MSVTTKPADGIQEKCVVCGKSRLIFSRGIISDSMSRRIPKPKHIIVRTVKLRTLMRLLRD